MIPIVGTETKPQHLPIGSLKFLGTNPYDEAIWRVVWSESRYYLVGAQHNIFDESAGGMSNDRVVRQYGRDPNLTRTEVCYKWLPLYPGIKSWVLEQWKSPIAFTGCTKEKYDLNYKDPRTGLLLLGPYPSRGEYDRSFVFPMGTTPTLTTVTEVVGRIKAGWDYTFNEHKAAIEEAEKRKKQSKDGQFRDFFLDRQQAFRNRPSNINPRKRKKEGVKINRSAEQVGLPKGAFFTK